MKTHLSLYGLTAFFLSLGISGTQGWAQEATVTLRSTVTGNQEQPRVMYILPWQPPAGPEYVHSMERELANELFAPIDREEFVRAMKYQALVESSPLTRVNSD